MKRRFIRDSTGEGYVDVAIAMLIILTFTASLFLLFPLFTARQSLDQTAKYVARTVELYGRADSETLESVFGNDAIMRPDDIRIETTWFDEAEMTIQLRTGFTVTVTKTIPITILRPALGSPIVFHVTISSTARGISEVYHK
jgi:Flp pilus assembly protein TadG